MYESLRSYLTTVPCPRGGHVYNGQLMKMMQSKIVKMTLLWHDSSFCCLSSLRRGARTKIYDIGSKFVKQKQCVDTVQ